MTAGQEPSSGIVTKASPRSVDETVSRLSQLIEEQGLTLSR